MQEFWESLGERGTITFYDRGWYTAAIDQALALNPNYAAALCARGTFEIFIGRPEAGIPDIERDFQDTLSKCRPVTLESIKNEKAYYKIMGSLMKFIAPMM